MSKVFLLVILFSCYNTYDNSGMVFRTYTDTVIDAPQPRSRSSKLGPVVTTTPQQIETTSKKSDDGCTTFGAPLQSQSQYEQSTKLPKWMKDYFHWHREQVASINRCNFRDYKYIILQCSKEQEKCGGLGDRLKALPFFIANGATYKRIFLIRWGRPTKLEEFLMPNEVHWSVPDWMYEELNNFANNTENKYNRKGKAVVNLLRNHPETLVISGSLQDYFGGSGLYILNDAKLAGEKDPEGEGSDLTALGWKKVRIIFHDLFYTLFKIAPPIAKLVEEKMQSANLVPGNFSASHYRAFYGTEHKKDTITEEHLAKKTRNALNCASSVQPGDPIFFASDSLSAVKFAREVMMNETETNTNTTSSNTSTAINRKKIVVFDEGKEAVHLDKNYQWKSGNVSDFYATFVDLLIMSNAKCMALGQGGYGEFANILSTHSHCVIQHDHQREMKWETCKWND